MWPHVLKLFAFTFHSVQLARLEASRCDGSADLQCHFDDSVSFLQHSFTIQSRNSVVSSTLEVSSTQNSSSWGFVERARLGRNQNETRSASLSSKYLKQNLVQFAQLADKTDKARDNEGGDQQEFNMPSTAIVGEAGAVAISLQTFSLVVLFLFIVILYIAAYPVLTAPRTVNKEAPSEETVSHGQRYRPDIDGLRAVAVVAVIFFHWNRSYLAGGWVGVDIFFVISGYVVTGSLISRSSLCSIDGFMSFYAARVKRLLPNSLLTTFITGLLVCLFIPKSNLGYSNALANIYTSGSYATLAAANIHFGFQHSNYFSTGADSLEMNPFTHMWSLGVEEQFYMLYPLLLLVLHGQAPTRDKLQTSLRRSPIVLGTCVALSLVARQRMASLNPEAAFFQLPFRFWELAAGGWVYELQASYREEQWDEITRNRWLHIPLELLAMASIGAAIVLPNMVELTNFRRTCAGVIGAVCCIIANSNADGILRRLLSIDFLVGLGKISYSLYLWHWPIFTIFRWTFGLDSAICLAGSLFTVGAVGVTAYYGIEKPVRQLVVPAWKVLLALIAGVVICQCWLAALSRSQFTAVPAVCPFANLPMNASLSAMLHGRPSDRCSRVYHSTLQPIPLSEYYIAFVTDRTQIPPYDSACLPGAEIDSEISVGPKRTILVVGDSHARHASDAFNASQAVRELYNIRVASLPSCGGFMRGAPRWALDKCDVLGYRARVLEEAKKLQANDIFVLSEHHTKPEELEVDAVRILHDVVVNARRASFIFYGDNPILQQPAGVPSCIPTRTSPSTCQTPYLYQSKIQALSATFARELAKLPSTYYFERWPLYCDAEKCDVFIPGTCTPAYIDTDHLDCEGKLHSSPFLCSFMEDKGLL